MEIKAYLNKPYEEQERVDFIIEQNHNKGYEIKETEEQLQAWGYTEEEKAEQERERLIEDYKQQLNDLDLKSIRAIRSNDTEYIAKYEAEAIELRNKIKLLTNQCNRGES